MLVGRLIRCRFVCHIVLKRAPSYPSTCLSASFILKPKSPFLNQYHSEKSPKDMSIGNYNADVKGVRSVDIQYVHIQGRIEKLKRGGARLRGGANIEKK